jgi:hypothetical protein
LLCEPSLLFAVTAVRWSTDYPTSLTQCGFSPPASLGITSEAGSDELDHFAMRKLRQNFSHSFTPRRPKHFNATSLSMPPRLAIANNANRSTERRPVDWVFDA